MSRGRAGRERWEFALDSRQMAAIAVGALVVVGSAFVLGMNAGKGVARRASPPVTEASLDAFDTAHANLPTPPEPKSWEYEKLGGRAPDAAAQPGMPAGSAAAAQARVPPPARPVATRPNEPASAAPAPAPEPQAEATAAAAPAAPAPAPAAAPPAPRATPPPAATPSAMERAIAAVGGAPQKTSSAPAEEKASSDRFVIQVGASPNRSEADRIARRFASRGARVLPADVDGKRWYRVRLAATTYENRADAERALSRLSRETGVRGFVTAAR